MPSALLQHMKPDQAGCTHLVSLPRLIDIRASLVPSGNGAGVQLGKDPYMQKLLALCGCQSGEDITENEADGCRY